MRHLSKILVRFESKINKTARHRNRKNIKKRKIKTLVEMYIDLLTYRLITARVL